MSKPPSMGKTGSNHFQTPGYAIIPLLPFITIGWTIWECACGKGNLADAFVNHGFDVLDTDIIYGNDFFKTTPRKYEYDCIVTNPPYSGKNKENFLARCYELGKPFALLMPVDALGGKQRQKMYRRFGLQILMLGGRIDFETPSGKGTGSWFETAWFTHGLNLPSDLNFSEIRKL